ncbi:HTH-type transcriptional repressor YtrA [Paraliobacillus ryukyuensis]|uniref:GntR family transcriptional regulator n=1 Tax=Paraliobacillus ryukyuensis TaxID=200904 RepID=A0A366DXE8_9BACI|nr:GntR family transcriptional regulator [Paraliobacillus ryukyuensis]RBO94555.1 GntR family transcriptional regulator [Paraliobacillus ryukyuensis]
MFDLDLRSRQPIYEQLVEKIKELIVNDVMKTDEKLPSVRTLAQEMTINPNTIQKAYRELEMQGYIYSLKGKGSFVDSLTKNISAEEIEKIRNELQKRLTEAFFIGISKEEIYTLVEHTYLDVGGDRKND